MGPLKITARVGAGGSSNKDGSPSTVTLTDTPSIYWQARGGKKGGKYAGGGGYSGGGGGFGGKGAWGNGGSNGGDGDKGKYAAGGSGTGVDITSYHLSQFTLSPGRRGKFYHYSRNVNWGGGGGGVLVGGSGPPREVLKGWHHQGEGYGGGGNRGSRALPGLILLEVVDIVKEEFDKMKEFTLELFREQSVE